MKKFSIRFVSIILSLILVISSLPLTVLSVSAADGDTATTNLAASDVAYCGTGVGTDSKYCVRFPEQGYTAIKHCEFTFTGNLSGNQAVGTFSSDALGYTKYVNISATLRQPLKTTAETLTVAFNTGKSGTVSICNSAGQYLFFRDEDYTRDDKYRYMFDRSVLGGTQTAFSLFVRESGNTTSGINGYKRVQNINEIKQGEKYLIAHPGKYDGKTGNAADGSAWYVLHPSKNDTDYVQVAKVYNTVLSSKAKRIQNGSFEYNADGSQYVQTSGNQPQSHEIQAWNTTAEENKVELFDKTSTAHMSATDSTKNYIPDGKYAAELNADEPGSLYQIVNTMPSSAYLWGLDHRGRSGADTMALVIGPNQEVRPSKNSGSTNSETTSSTTKKNYGKDQFMQMVEWAKSQEKITLPDYSKSISGNEPQNITVYSKPFGLNGSFKSNDELSPFSLVPTDEHTEEWHIWIMTSGNSDWSSYGSNDEENGINIYGNINSSDMEKLKQYFYRVPAGQTESMFAFVPIDTAYQHQNPGKTTLGNLLDNVNFEVFNSFTASSTNHGAGSLTDNDNGHANEQDITDTHPISVYTKDNSTQNLVAEIKKEDSGKDVTFASVYLTTQNAKGESVTVFKPLKNCEIDESQLEWKTDSENKNRQIATVTLNGKQVTVSRLKNDNKGYVYDIPADMWLKTTDSNGNTDYVMQIKNVSSSMDAHFIFLKSPTVTYDANSTKDFEYEISDTNTTNVYNFEPIANADGVKYIDPVSSHDPKAPNDGWKFIGWKLFDTDGVVKNNGNDVILSGTNAIACNTTQESGKPTRTFIVVDGKNAKEAFDNGKDIVDSNNAIIGKEWTVKDGVTPVYNQESEALSLVAQWKFKNTFTPEYQDNITDTNKVFTQGETGGTVELKNTTDSENYTADPNGTKSYFAGVGEQVVATAKAKNLYTFIGWYDSDGNVVTTNPELVVNQVKGEIGKYHARFQKTGVSVNFYYLEYNKDTKSYEYKVYDGGKYTQYLNKNGIAKQPTGDSKKVKTWYTSRTNLGADTAFDFNKTLDKSIDLYAAPAFTFNYLNQFQFAEPWRMITYATLKYDGQYIDMKTDPDVTDYKVYILKAESKDEAQPTSKDIKENKKTQVVSKDQQGIMFNSTTKTGKTFNRVGAQYNNQYIFDMKKPVWVTFEFTYRGITYTANVKNRSLYNNIDTYMKTTGQQYYTEYSEQQKAVLDAINKMYEATAKYNITEATNYNSSVSVSNDVKNSVKDPEAGYNFKSSTTIRNIEPWGFKYSFSVNGKALSEYSDYGVVVLSDYEKEPTNAKELVNNEKAVMYSKSGGNIYSVEGDANTAAAYHVNGITIANYDKPTYAVFFVQDSSGYHYSSVISNSYKEIAEKDTSESSAVSTAIFDYAQKYRTYVDAISSKNN